MSNINQPWPDKAALLALWERTTPDIVVEGLKDKPGYETVEAAAAVFEYLGEKLESLFAQRLHKNATGPQCATGTLNVYWTSAVDFPIVFPVSAFTVWGLKSGGRNLVPYHNSSIVVIAPNAASVTLLGNPFTLHAGLGLGPVTWADAVTDQPFSCGVEALRPGMNQDVLAGRLCVPFYHGPQSGDYAGVRGDGEVIRLVEQEDLVALNTTLDRWRIVEITAAPPGYSALVGERRQIQYIEETTFGAYKAYACSLVGGFGPLSGVLPGDYLEGFRWRVLDLADAGIFCANPDDIMGGSFWGLDMLGGNKGIRRVYGESDASYRERQGAIPDTVSPAAIRRGLSRIFNRLAPGYSYLFYDQLSDPLMCAFGNDRDAPSIAGQTRAGALNYLGLWEQTGGSYYYYYYPYPTPEYIDNPALGWTREHMRAHFVVKVPTFSPLPSGWTAETRASFYGTVYDTVERHARAAGVTWEMLRDATLG